MRGVKIPVSQLVAYSRDISPGNGGVALESNRINVFDGMTDLR
jgi:hypothetical protein